MEEHKANVVRGHDTRDEKYRRFTEIGITTSGAVTGGLLLGEIVGGPIGAVIGGLVGLGAVALSKSVRGTTTISAGPETKSRAEHH